MDFAQSDLVKNALRHAEAEAGAPRPEKAHAWVDEPGVERERAVEQLEQVAATLKQLPQGERDQFITFLAESADLAAKSKNHERSEFLRSLPEQLGLR